MLELAIIFTVLILYSYRIHAVLAGYLFEHVEPELQRLSGTSVPGWETYYLWNRKQVPGIRRWFFVVSLWVVTGVSLAFVYPTAVRQGFVPAFWTLAVLYGGADVAITLTLGRRGVRDVEARPGTGPSGR